MKKQASTRQNPRGLHGPARYGWASVLALFSCWLYLVSPGVPTLAAQQITYTALGDSLAFGAFAPLGQGYVPLFRDNLARDTARRVVLYNLGVPGWTSQDLKQALEGNFFFQLSVWSSQAVTVDIGGNDLRAVRTAYQNQSCGGVDNQDCLRAAVVTFKQNWNVIIGRILQLRGLRKTLIRTMDIYNPYVDEDKAKNSWSQGEDDNDFVILKSYLDEVNQYIAQTSASFGACAKVYEAFNGPAGDVDPAVNGFLSFDGFHPNRAGHAKIAELLQKLGYAPLLP